MTRPADGDGASKNSRQRQSQTGNTGGYLTSVFAVAVLTFSFLFDVGHCSSSTVPCPFELINCLGNEACNECLGLLQDEEFLYGGDGAVVCSELYHDVCVTIDDLSCETENDKLMTLLTCIAEDTYDCTDFTTCADATAGSGGGGDTSTSTAPTPAPTVATPTTTLPPGSAGGNLAPTAAPSIAADGSGAISTSIPSAAPSAASAAPTGFDTPHGGGEGMFSATPTASPTVFEDPGDRIEKDAVNGGVISKFTAGSSGCSAVSAAAMVGSFTAVVVVAAWGV